MAIPYPKSEQNQHDEMVAGLENELYPDKQNKEKGEAENVRTNSGEPAKEPDTGSKGRTAENENGETSGESGRTEDTGITKTEFDAFKTGLEKKFEDLSKDLEKLLKLKAQGKATNIAEPGQEEETETKAFKERWADTGLLR